MDGSDNNDNQSLDQNSNWQYTPGEPQQYDGSGMAQSTGVPLQQIPAVEWTASEYVAHEKSAGWYLLLAGGTLAIVGLIFFLTSDVLASIVILLCCLAIGVYASRKPSDKHYVIDEQGIHIDEVLHSYREFRSFSVIEEGAIDSIWLKPLKRLKPLVVMYFSPEDEEKIVDVLANFLPHEQRELDAVDRFAKRIRF